MPFRNGPRQFGGVSRSLHWLMAALILAQIPLGLRLVRIKPTLDTLWLYGLHKTMGFAVLILVLIRIGWHLYSPPPPPLGPATARENRLARLVHRLIYGLLLFIPLAGWVASAATGLDVMIFDRWTLPPIAPVSEAWEHLGFALHGWSAKLLILVLAAHIAGAARRAWLQDGTLTRMITGRAP